jgi:hypothetical protein
MVPCEVHAEIRPADEHQRRLIVWRERIHQIRERALDFDEILLDQMLVIDHDREESAVGRRRDVGRHVGIRQSWRIDAVFSNDSRNRHELKVGDRLRLPRLDDLEVFFLQVRDRLVVLVSDDDIDGDVLDARAKGRLRE